MPSISAARRSSPTRPTQRLDAPSHRRGGRRTGADQPSEPRSESAWERKKRATRQDLRDAAVRLVAARGLAAVTAEDIAAAAGVSTRTFFNYFASKEDAVVGWDPDRVAAIGSSVRRQPPTVPAVEALRAAMLDALGTDDQDVRELLRRQRLTSGEPHLVARQVECFGEVERQLTAALAERRGTSASDDHYAALVVAAVLAASRLALAAWSADGGRRPLRAVLAEHLDLLAAGLPDPATPPASGALSAERRKG
jgi:AcrR family transcriptional regulator